MSMKYFRGGESGQNWMVAERRGGGSIFDFFANVINEWPLMQTRRRRCSKNMNIAVFPCIDFELTLVAQARLSKQQSTYKNAYYNT